MRCRLHDMYQDIAATQQHAEPSAGLKNNLGMTRVEA
jgi:hypothetical protein